MLRGMRTGIETDLANATNHPQAQQLQNSFCSTFAVEPCRLQTKTQQSFLLSVGRSQAGTDAMVKILDADELEFDAWPSFNKFRKWKIAFPK